jgi:hypothetical protein
MAMTKRFEFDWRWLRVVVELFPTRIQIRKYRVMAHGRTPALGRKLACDVARRLRQPVKADTPDGR